MDQLMRFCEPLEMLALPANPPGEPTSRQRFPSRRDDGSLHDFSSAEHMARNSRKEADLAGYRWDDGIGEWVSKNASCEDKRVDWWIWSLPADYLLEGGTSGREAGSTAKHDVDELSILKPDQENEVRYEASKETSCATRGRTAPSPCEESRINTMTFPTTSWDFNVRKCSTYRTLGGMIVYIQI